MLGAMVVDQDVTKTANDRPMECTCNTTNGCIVHGRSANTAMSPIKRLVELLATDAAYVETWKANIAMAFYDEYARSVKAWTLPTRDDVHGIANRAAEYFLRNLCYPRVAAEQAKGQE